MHLVAVVVGQRHVPPVGGGEQFGRAETVRAERPQNEVQVAGLARLAVHEQDGHLAESFDQQS